MSHPFPPTALWRRHTQTVRDRASSYKIDYVIVIKNFLNPEDHQNLINGSKVTAILLKEWICNQRGYPDYFLSLLVLRICADPPSLYVDKRVWGWVFCQNPSRNSTACYQYHPVCMTSLQARVTL